MEIRDYKEAENTITSVAQNGKPKTLIPIALSLLGAIKEDAGKYPEAIQTYNEFMDRFPDHFYAPKILESLARVYEITNQLENAKAAYEKLATLYPTTEWSAKAQARLGAIANTPQTPVKPK
jgi:TolA-binding protein